MKLLKSMLKNQAGQALPMVLILLVLGGLLIVPMLSFMTTNLTAGRVIEGKTEGIYAADAGIADALWKLGNGVPLFASGPSYLLTENGNPVIINGMTVTVEKVAITQHEGGDLYTLRSTATSTLDGKVKAVITAQAVAGSNYAWLFEHAITSAGNATVGNNSVIYGGVLYGGSYAAGNNVDVRTGTVEQGTVILPTAEELSAYYLSKFDATVCADPANYCPANPYPSSTYSIPSGATKSTPHMIPWLYRNGNLTYSGSGYGKLSGTIYLTGDFSAPPGVTIDLNGNTIFVEGNIDFQSGSTIYGPGCIIAVGDINYQPNLGVGDQLIGVDDEDTEASTTAQDRFALYKFQAQAGMLSSFQVKCYIPDSDPAPPPAHVKVAVYDDDGPDGAPGTLLRAADYADNITVISSWNPINLTDYELFKKNWYWLAAISDYPVISKKTVSSTTESSYKSQIFTGFQFTNNPTGLVTPNTEEYFLRGFTNSQEFVFIMSVTGTTHLQPNASFYGSIAGNVSVELKNNSTLYLVGVPEEGLDFPGLSGSGSGSGTGGNSPPLLNYNIQ